MCIYVKSGHVHTHTLSKKCSYLYIFYWSMKETGEEESPFKLFFLKQKKLT